LRRSYRGVCTAANPLPKCNAVGSLLDSMSCGAISAMWLVTAACGDAAEQLKCR
jgi:hypothetical protein